MTLAQCIDALKNTMGDLQKSLVAYQWKGSKAAGRRARVLTVELAKIGKEFRALSIGRKAEE